MFSCGATLLAFQRPLFTGLRQMAHQLTTLVGSDFRIFFKIKDKLIYFMEKTFKVTIRAPANYLLIFFLQLKLTIT